ncbi:MAG: M48 family metalloprotease [Gammaproteobacteria bacterium]|nr:M48 family metalloprotease [Gammaproteobacteria bacterium]
MRKSFRRASCQFFTGFIAFTIIGVSTVTHGGQIESHYETTKSHAMIMLWEIGDSRYGTPPVFQYNNSTASINGPNAFYMWPTEHAPARIVVDASLMWELNESERFAVLAHELSHWIWNDGFNGDSVTVMEKRADCTTYFILERVGVDIDRVDFFSIRHIPNSPLDYYSLAMGGLSGWVDSVVTSEFSHPYQDADALREMVRNPTKFSWRDCDTYARMNR